MRLFLCLGMCNRCPVEAGLLESSTLTGPFLRVTCSSSDVGTIAQELREAKGEHDVMVDTTVASPM